MGETDANWDPMSEAFQSAHFSLYGQKFPSRQSGEENLCLFVSGFPSTVTNHAVRNLLSEAGQINFIKTVPDRKRWNCIIAYVYAATYKDALAIIGLFNNFNFLNSTLRVGFTVRKKPVTDPAGESNVGSGAESRGSLSGLSQTLSDVESLGSRHEKAEVMDFQRVGTHQSQQKVPMGRSKLLVSLTSSEGKTTVGHGVGLKSGGRPSAAAAAGCGALSDAMDADDDDDGHKKSLTELQQNKYCEQLKQLSASAAQEKDQEDRTKTRGLQSVPSRSPMQNGHQVANTSVSSHSSIPPTIQKRPELCAFCQAPGQLFCSICKTTYCSQSCQRNDWPQHKNVCQSKSSKPDRVLNSEHFDNAFDVGVDLDELSSTVEINLPDGKSFGTTSTKVKLMESSLPIDAFTSVVLATEAVSPSEIWVVEEKNSQLLNQMKKSMKKHYSCLQNDPQSTAQLMLNDHCVSLFSFDSCFYRTRIESVNRDGTFDVRYIDYGNVETVPPSRIYALDAEFSSVPSVAVRCRLADLVPADGSGVWSKRALKMCSELLPVLQSYKVKCIEKTSFHSILLVDSAGRRISDEFIEAGVAKRLSKSVNFSPDEINCETMEETKISPVVSKEDEEGIGLSPLPSPSGSELVKEVAVNCSHGMPTASKHLFRGAKVLVKILNIVNPTQFWVHLVSGSSDLEKLPELEVNMMQHYGKKPPQKGFTPTVRMLYASKCRHSQKWVRVHVLKYDWSGVDAFLLDYGVCQAMSVVGLFSLEGQFLSLPFQAVQCTLAGIRPKAGYEDWTQGTVDYFQRLISHVAKAEQLEAAVCQIDGSCVHLELMLTSGETVSDLLVKYGMAEFAPDLQPGFFVLSRNLISDGKEGKTSKMSPLNLQISPSDRSSGETVEGLLKPLETSTATPKLKDMIRNALATDKIHEVIVTDATHFFGFYVQVITVERATLLQTMEEKLNEIYCDYKGSFRPCVGDIVAARFSADEKWYRGLVREVTSPNSALVMFIDYGNCDNVAVKFIGPLDASLLTFPVFAYRCTLQEPTGVVFVQPWNPDFLLPLSGMFQMKILREKESVYLVELFSKEHNINWKNKLVRDGVIQLKRTSPVDLLKKPQSSSAASHLISSPLGDKVASSASEKRPKFEVGLAVSVVHINSVTDFYVQVEDKDLERTFLGLMQRLNDECIKCELSSYVPKGPGEVVAALYDRVWYRVKVLQVMSSAACRLEFVDYGNIDVVACSHLRPLPSGCRLDIIPEMAVPCCLFNLSDPSSNGGSGDCLDAESSKWFRNLCLEKRFTVTGMCNFVSNRYAIDLRSAEMTSTVRDNYLKMLSERKVSPLMENASAGKSPTDKFLGTQLANSSSGEQQLRAPVTSSLTQQRPSDKRVHFANDTKFPSKGQASGSQLGPTGSMQSGFRSTANNQSEFKSNAYNQSGFRSTGNTNQSGFRSNSNNQSGFRSSANNQSGFRSTANYQSDSRSTGNYQSDSRSTGNSYQSGFKTTGNHQSDQRSNGQSSGMFNGTAPRSLQNNQPQFAENKQPDSKLREISQSGQDITESHQADLAIAEMKSCNSAISENDGSSSKVAANNHSAPKVAEMNRPRPKVDESESSLSDYFRLQSTVKSSQNNVSKTTVVSEKSGNLIAAMTRGQTAECPAVAEQVVRKQPLRNAAPVQKLPEPGALVCIVHANTPSDFSVQVCNDQRMKDLLEQLNRCCNSEHLVAHRPKAVGELVAALFEGLWYRAEVMEMPSGDDVRLLFIDFGNTDIVNVRDVRVLPVEYHDDVIPRQAVRCHHRMADDFSGDWAPEVVQWFKLNCENSTFVVDSIQSQPSDGVCLISLKTPESLQNLSEKLLVQQLVATDRPLPPSGQAVVVEVREHTADDRNDAMVETEKSKKHLQTSEKSDEVVACNSSLCPRLLVVDQSICVVHVNSPSDFYVQLFDDECKQQMTRFLAEFHQSAMALSASPYANGRVGDIVAGLFDNCWFRAEVIELLPGDRARLFFVDYGNVSEVEHRNIRSTMPKALLYSPRWAVQCAIEGVVGNEANGEWGKDAIAWFKQRFENDVCTVKTVIPFEENCPCVVDLIGSQGKESIKEQIISNRFGQALSIRPAEKTMSQDTELNSAFARAASDADGKIAGYVVKVNNNVDGILSHAPLTRDANVKVIHANKPSEFFVQLADESAQLPIAQLCLDLTTHCSNLTRDSYRPSMGEYVAGLFEGMWFRAQVMAILPQDRFELFFVDFGNVDIIGSGDICALPAKFLNVLPKQAILCGLLRLAGTDPAQKWSGDSCVWFKAYCENFDFRVQDIMLDDSGKCLIDMVRKGEQQSIREQLLLSGRAVVVTDQAKLPLSMAEKHQRAPSVIPDKVETQPSSVVTACKPMYNSNTKDLHSVAQELPSNRLTTVSNQPTVAAIHPAASNSSALSSTNRSTASTDLIKAPARNIESSVDPPKMASAKPGSFTINSGDVVTIVHVNSPSDFYVQLQTDSLRHEFIELLKKLNEWCTSGATKPYRPTSVEEIVGANFEGIWYRAEVLHIVEDSKFQLRFIDYGNVAVANSADIRSLPVSLISSLPRQAVPCALSGVLPVERDGRWSEEAVGWFQENTENVSSFAVRSSSLVHDGKYSVDVCANGNEEHSLREMLISLKFGRRSDETDALGNTRSNTVDYKSHGQSHDHSDVAQSSAQPAAQAKGQLCSQSIIEKSLTESGVRSTGLLREEIVSGNDRVGVRTQLETGCSRPVFNFCDLPQLRLPSDVTVEVTLPTNPASFWCQDLLHMAEMINCCQFQESPPPTSAGSCRPQVIAEKDEVCLGFHEKYGEWYRVVVKNILEDGLTVRFMDYGDEAKVSFDHVRPLPEALRSFPPLAFHCSLESIDAVGSGWTEQAKAVFHSLVTSQILTASIQSHDTKTDNYKVILKVQSSGQLVGDELVKAGLASHI